MVQQMPEFDAGRIDVDHEQREDDWRKAVILMASATEREMLDPALPGPTLLYRLFHAERRAPVRAARLRARAAAAPASASTACCARSSATSSPTCATRAAWSR